MLTTNMQVPKKVFYIFTISVHNTCPPTSKQTKTGGNKYYPSVVALLHSSSRQNMRSPVTQDEMERAQLLGLKSTFLSLTWFRVSMVSSNLFKFARSFAYDLESGSESTCFQLCPRVGHGIWVIALMKATLLADSTGATRLAPSVWPTSLPCWRRFVIAGSSANAVTAPTEEHR